MEGIIDYTLLVLFVILIKKLILEKLYDFYFMVYFKNFIIKNL